MQAMDDMALLREYATRNSEAAFETLVSRRVGFVYSAALRQVRDPHLAEEVTQAVFIILAQKAGRISGQTILTGWLFKTTRFAALAQMRAAGRRRRYEQEAQMQSELQQTAPDVFWEQMSPLLDEALAALGETDRQAVLLRFFENKSLAEVGNILGTGEDSARKRVGRSIEKLHRYFHRRGVSSTAAIIAGTISANSVQVAPLALAKSVTAVALAKGAAAGGPTLALIKGALKIMAWTKAKTVIVTSVGVVLTGGITTILFLHYQDPIVSGKRAIANHLATPIDLTAHYSTPASYFDQITEFPAWKSAPRGFEVYDHVPLEIGGQMCLWSSRATSQGLLFPEQFLDISVNQKFETLYIYHGAFFASPDKTPVCAVVFRYTDGSSVTNQLLYGADMLDWNYKRGRTGFAPTGTRSKLAWVGGTATPGKKEPLRFCLTAIENPQPDLEVATIDLFSCKLRTTACIMAMTTGKSGLMK
jgi:RNA polymerase sigma factor (sigma-70 family)